MGRRRWAFGRAVDAAVDLLHVDELAGNVRVGIGLGSRGAGELVAARIVGCGDEIDDERRNSGDAASDDNWDPRDAESAAALWLDWVSFCCARVLRDALRCDLLLTRHLCRTG